MGDLPIERKSWNVPLSDKYYDLDNDAKAFFKKETGIEDDEDLKAHIIAVQKKAFSIYPYPCIRIFEFTRLKLGRLPAYGQLLELGKSRKGAILLDLGCCFGNDVRKAVQDGYPVENTLSADLRKGLWDLGHELFRSTPQTFTTPFIEGDIFNPEFLSPIPPFTETPSAGPPALNSVTSLNELRGHVSAIHVSAFFHLFTEDQQEHIARALAGLLSPEAGSMILGVHGAMATKGFWVPTGYDYQMFCHCPDSWKDLWEGIFGKGRVEVKARLRKEIGGDDFFDTWPGNKDPFHVMEWSVTRL